MDRKKRIRALATISLGLTLLSCSMEEYPYNPQYEVIAKQNGPFGRYSNGYIYIGDKDYIESIINKVDKNDVLIILGTEEDENGMDPNASILSSYRITDENDRNDILNVLKLYDDINNTEWDRTMESMRVEWNIHNFLYDMDYERERTMNVDLDNSDENKYNNIILKRLFR